VRLAELVGGTERVRGNILAVDEKSVQEVLGQTGLFSLRGVERLGFSHQTYAEFLAARYLKERGATLEQMRGLVMHSAGSQAKVIPQLHETAAWLAGMEPRLFRLAMSTDPVVLLRSDIATVEDSDRAKLVDELLRLCAEEKLVDRDLSLRRCYHRLRHPSIAGQLLPHITNRDLVVVARRVAIDIAEACEVQELQNALLDIALDKTEVYHIRQQAAWAISRIGDSGTFLLFLSFSFPGAVYRGGQAASSCSESSGRPSAARARNLPAVGSTIRPSRSRSK